MYTMMMMTALSTAPDTAQFNGFFRDLFHGNSCNGNSSSSSASDPKTSCQGNNSCNGCTGGGLFHGGLFNRSSNSNSCHGSNSCNGNTSRSSSCNGSTSRGTSCNGNAKAYASSCNGSMPMYAASCFGSSCFGSNWSQGSMPYGMPYDMAQPVPTNYGGMAYGGGCFGSGGSMGMPSQAPYVEADPSYPTIPSPSVPMIPRTMPFPEAQPMPAPAREGSTYKVPVDSQRATVVVKLPADAKLYAEGRQLLLTSAERRFVTPPLDADRDAIYSFRVEYVRDGEVITQTKKVYVQAGGIVNVEFNELQSKVVPTKPSDVFTAFAPLK